MKISHIFTKDIRVGKLFDIPKQPVNVMLDVTNACNNRCVFCYNPDNSEYQCGIPDYKQLKDIVSKIGETGTKEILYLGGEPFAFPEMKLLLLIGKKLGLSQRAVSNGSFFTDTDICLELKDCGLDEVGISLHSSVEESHDLISGRNGAFREAFAGIENCLAAGIQTFVQYSPNTLNSPDDLIKLSEFLSSRFGSTIGMIDINRLLPIGQGANVKHILLKDEQWFSLLVSATELPNLGYDVRVELTPFCWITSETRKHHVSDEVLEKIFQMNRGCFMWVAQLALDYQGRVKFCPAGTAVGPSIVEVNWPVFWREWEEFQKYRSFSWNRICIDFETASACKYFYHCLGGCKYSKGIHYEVDQYSLGMRSFERMS